MPRHFFRYNIRVNRVKGVRVDTGKLTISSLDEALEEIKRLRQKLREKTRENHTLSRMNDLAAHGNPTARYGRLQDLYTTLLLDNGTFSVLILDDMLCYVLGSRAASAITDAQPNDLQGQPLSQVLSTRLDPSWRDKILAQAEETLHTRRQWRDSGRKRAGCTLGL